MKKIIVYSLSILFIVSCSEQPQNINSVINSKNEKEILKSPELQPPSLILTETKVSNSPLPSSSPSVLEIRNDSKLTCKDETSGKVLEPQSLDNLNIKCPTNVAVTKDGKSIYVTNYNYVGSEYPSKPEECTIHPKPSYIYKIDSKKNLDVVKLKDNKPFYACNNYQLEIQTDKENNLFYLNKDTNVDKITPEGNILEVTNDKFSFRNNDCNKENTSIYPRYCSYDSGSYKFQIDNGNIYYRAYTNIEWFDSRDDFIFKQDKNSKITPIISELTDRDTNYTVFNNEVYILGLIGYRGYALVKLLDIYPENKSLDYNDKTLVVLSQLRYVLEKDPLVNQESHSPFLNNYVTCIKCNSRGEIFFNDLTRNVIWKVTPIKNKIVEPVIFVGNRKPGFKDGQGIISGFNYPASFDFDSQDNMYVADTANNAIRKVTPNGDVSTLYKYNGSDK